MTPIIRMLHLADFHLGSYPDPHPTTVVMGDITHLADSAALDLIVVAGDLFDHNRLPDTVVEQVAQSLYDTGVPVVVLPGNHDCYDSGSIYKRHRLWEKYDDRIIIMKAEMGEDVFINRLHLWGKPVIEHSQQCHPLGGISAPLPGFINVALAHGHLIRNGERGMYSSQILTTEIALSGYDYIGLGHWHVLEDVSREGVTAYYSGSPLGPLLEGVGGKGLLVTMQPGTNITVEHVLFNNDRKNFLQPGRTVYCNGFSVD